MNKKTCSTCRYRLQCKICVLCSMKISDEDAETNTCREWQPKLGMITRLYEDDDIILEKMEGGKYRVTFFKEDNHWGGDITFSKSEGVIYDSKQEINN